MQIDRKCFLNAVAHGWEIYGYAQGYYFEDGCGCAIGVARKMLHLPTNFTLARELGAYVPDHPANPSRRTLWDFITRASDAAGNKEQAYLDVMAVVDKFWPARISFSLPDPQARN